MVNKWELKGKVSASNYRKSVLSKLNEGAFAPRELEKSLGIKISHISSTLGELQELGLIVCLTPSLRKGKQYGITKLGREVLGLIEK